MGGEDDYVVAVTPADRRRSSKKSARSSDSTEAQMTVGCATEVKLISVDDVAETFHIALLIHVHFETKSLKADKNAENEWYRERDYDGYLPKIIMVNLVDGGHFDVVVRVNRYLGVVWASYQATCHINESLELFQFPFDRQLFRVGFKSPNAQFCRWYLPLDILDFPDKLVNGKSVENDSPYLVSCELNTWTMAGIQVGIFQDDPDPVSLTKPEFELTIQAERDPIFFLCNYVVIVYLIVLLNAASVVVDVNSMEDRLTYSSALLLAAIAFKFTLSSSLPKVGYQTYLDAYILVAFAFIAVGSLEHIFVSPYARCFYKFYSDYASPEELAATMAKCQADITESATRFDGLFQLGYTAAWTLVNLIAGIVSYCPALVRPSWKYVLDNQIGETESTVKRTNVVWDYDNPEKGAVML